jgi:hypothetical protein
MIPTPADIINGLALVVFLVLFLAALEWLRRSVGTKV